jgi:hypothetical protein
MVVVLWRAGLRIREALALAEHDLDPLRGSVLVRKAHYSSRLNGAASARSSDEREG